MLLNPIKRIFQYSQLRGKLHFYSSSFCMASTMDDIDPQQKLLLEENCILVDKNDNNIGSASKKDCHLLGLDGSPPPLHRAFSVFLFNTKNQLLLQQRSKFKITFPLHYTNTCCSHPLNVEEELQEEETKGVRLAACRRLSIELGIPKHELNPSELTYLTRIYYSSPSSQGVWGEHEIDYILFLKKDVSLNVNENEVREIDYVSKNGFADFLNKLKKNDIPITPWFRMVTEKFLMEWWENIEDLHKFVDHKTIHIMR